MFLPISGQHIAFGARLHKYLYANSDPANNVDPTGEFSAAEMAAVSSFQSELAQLEAANGQLIMNGLRDDVGITIDFMGFGTATISIDSSIDFADEEHPDQVALGGMGGFFKGAGRVVAKTAKRAFVLAKVARALRSKNPEVSLPAQVAKRYRNVLTDFNRNVFGPGGRKLTDFDVELDNAVIEVTAGTSGAGKPGQIGRRILPNTKKPVIFFGPNVTKGSAFFREIEKPGAYVARDWLELDALVKALHP